MSHILFLAMTADFQYQFNVSQDPRSLGYTVIDFFMHGKDIYLINALGVINTLQLTELLEGWGMCGEVSKGVRQNVLIHWVRDHNISSVE